MASTLDRGRLGDLARSDTGRAAGMAIAVMIGNVVGLLFTVVFTRRLGATGYGSLSALISTYIILMVPGAAVQTTVAREVSAAYASGDPDAGAGVRRWLEALALALVGVMALSVLGRQVLAAVIGVKEVPWAAAGTLPSACLWLILSIERGALQGFHRYRLVGASWIVEATTRLLFALVLVGAGAGVTGAFLGTPLSLAAVALMLLIPLTRALPRGTRGAHPLGHLFTRAGGPVAALALVAWMQDGNVIIVKHIASGHQAGAYGAAAVAAKAIIWIAVGLGLYLVPEVARRVRLGDHTVGVFGATLGIISLGAVPMVLVYAVAGKVVIRLASGGHNFLIAANALPLLGLAFSLLACTYLAVQYHLALHRSRFIAALVVGAIAQPAVLVAIGAHLTSLALGLVAVNGALAVTMVVLALRARPVPPVSGEEEDDLEPGPLLSQVE